jgi:hypothetical protein
MLGGFASISMEDVKGSSEFLREYLEAKYGFALGRTRAVGTHLESNNSNFVRLWCWHWPNYQKLALSHIRKSRFS